MVQKEWYTDGLRFSCTQCGDCCTGPPGYVWVDDTEAKEIADHLAISVSQFRKMYTHRRAGRTTLAEHPAAAGYDCVFLARAADGKATCSIYPVRPIQCRTWPFWKDNIKTETAWEQTKSVCPGSGKGRLVPIEKIRILRDTTPEL